MSGVGADAPRLLVITPDYPPARGGIQALIGGLAGAMRRFDVHVVALSSPGAREFDAGGRTDVRRVAPDERLRAARNVPLNAVAVLEAVRFRPAATISAHVVTSPAAAVIDRLLGAPTAQYFHANEIGDKPRLSAFAARRAAASIAVSTYTASLLAGVGAPADRLVLIPPGIEMPGGNAARRTRDPGEPPTLLTVARLTGSYKGHDVLMRALAAVRSRVPDVVWVVIGDGPLRGQLEADARAAGVADRVRFLGAVADAERDSWLARAEVFVMPSRLPGGGLAGEGFGIVFMEAAAHGTPVVAGNVGGAVDAVADGETGLLVDPRDPAAVAEAIVRVLTEPDLASRLGAAAAQRARSFAWPVIAARVEDVLLELIDTATAHGGRAGGARHATGSRS